VLLYHNIQLLGSVMGAGLPGLILGAGAFSAGGDGGKKIA
jgi:hypothetical protein